MSDNQRPATGWYVDPGVPDRLRYWDGERWTEDYLPNVPPGSGTSPFPPNSPPGHHRGTNGMAIASMILGIVWVMWVGSVLALVFGYVALSQIKRTGEGGRGMAIAGIVLGWVGVALLLLFIVLGVVTRDSTDYTCFGDGCHLVQGAPAVG